MKTSVCGHKYITGNIIIALSLSIIDTFITRLYISLKKHRIDKIFISKYAPQPSLLIYLIIRAYLFGHAYKTG